MAEKQPENSGDSQPEPNPPSTNADIGVGGNVDGNLTVGNSNVINYYYQQVVEKNVEKHEPEYWALQHPYPMPKNFTGRIAERALLTYWLKEDSENHLFILRALGGFGKSALAWQWITHDVDIKEYPKVLWWSFYEGDPSFDHFIKKTLKYLKIKTPRGQRTQAEELLKVMQSQKILLIMDGFERELRAYSGMSAAYKGDEDLKLEDNQLDCANINAEIFLKNICSLPNIKGKVLMTTRLTPRAIKPRGECLQGCHEEELTAMQKADAVAFFHKQKIKGTHPEVEAACSPYGYHPLSLRLLAGCILKDFDNPADIVVAQKFKIDGDLKAHQHHVLEVSYNSLPPHEQKLLGTIACFRAPVELKALQSIVENKSTLDADLHDLIERGLLHFDERNKRFDLHPIVRRYVYQRLTTPDRIAVHLRLRDYFASMPKPEKIEKLEDLSAIIELYHHTVQAGEYEQGNQILMDQLVPEPLHYQLGAYQLIIELELSLFPNGIDNPPKLSSEEQRESLYDSLAISYSLSGEPRRAVQLFLAGNEASIKSQDKEGLAIGLGNVAFIAQQPIGALLDAEHNLNSSIDLCSEINDVHFQTLNHTVTVNHIYLTSILIYRGLWEEAEQEISKGLELAQKESDVQLEGEIWLYRALRALLRNRDSSQSNANSSKSAIQFSQRAIDLVEETARTRHPYERDFVRAHWLLGSAYRLDNQLERAENQLIEALTRGRSINLVEIEASILIDLARLRYDQKNYEEAKSLAEEALTITERCGYVLQGADVNLFLAQYALEQEKDKVKAKEYAQTALKLATCDGPPYYYKVAYEEAARMLESLKI